MGEEGVQGSPLLLPSPHSASCTSSSCTNGDEAGTGQSWGKRQQVCRMVIVQDGLLSSAISCLKATAVTKVGPDIDGYQILGILSYSHFTLMEKTDQGTQQERTEVMGSPEAGSSHGPLTNTQRMLTLTCYQPNSPGQPARTGFPLQCWSSPGHPTHVEM